MEAYLGAINNGQNNARPPQDCRDWRSVIYWQSLVHNHTKEDSTASEDQIIRTSKVWTCESSKPNAHNQSLGTPTPALGRSPLVTNYAMGTSNPANTPSADETYANTVLLLLLQPVTMNIGPVFQDIDWLAPQIPLKLTMTVLLTSS
jgi:hypothetical protein